MATYGANTTIKINGSITQTLTASNPGVTTTPASGTYSICQVGIVCAAGSANMTYTVQVAGQTFATAVLTAGNAATITGIYVGGPSTALTVTNTGGTGGANIASISGVNFINSP